MLNVAGYRIGLEVKWTLGYTAIDEVQTVEQCSSIAEAVALHDSDYESRFRYAHRQR